jgi:hypothetical protein
MIFFYSINKKKQAKEAQAEEISILGRVREKEWSEEAK